ncbi:sensor domain-containing protein [Paenibacillus silviterrae]|uniref:sensor domain-containing protein n=1 Tax=Paenibacillus silviterrae TaxID=3242194 RepID=UPI0025427918|nr:bifunctional diguanylate cyclase/phosphodiesterase [Paenibacillus chinjuensis]
MDVILQNSLISLFDDNPDPCYVVDLKGRFTACNEAFFQVTGYSEKELIGISFLPLIAPAYVPMSQMIFRKVAYHGHRADFDIGILRKNGEHADITITAVPVMTRGQITGVIGIAKDMTHRKQLEKALLTTQMHLQNIFESIDVCLWSMDVRSRKLLSISPACQIIYGYTQEDFSHEPSLWRQLIHPEDLPRVEEKQASLGDGMKIKHEYRIFRADGSLRWIYDYTVPVMDEYGELLRLDGVITDITERKQTEVRLHDMAYRDALTGLPNRRCVRTQLTDAMERAERCGQMAAVLYLDLDGFKVINDSLGHELGDQLLCAAALRISRSVPENAKVARLGGDEFAVIVENISSLSDAGDAAKRILLRLSEPFLLAGYELIITASIGISGYPIHGHHYEDLIQRADQAMYLSKAKGKNTYQLFTDDLTDKYQERLLLEQGLRKALEHDELEVHYQPIVDAENNRIKGMEALLRWKLNGSFVPPMEFIAIAEEIGLIEAIGQWVLQQACKQTKEWIDQGFSDFFISVNVSVKQLEQGHFTAVVKDALDQCGLEPAHLHLEVTETAAMSNVHHTVHILQKLADLGISISIDDFGTGYSSIGYLEKFPIHTIKIDRSFVKDGKDAIMKAVIAMAKSLQLNVIAEGVESAEDKDKLLGMGCTQMQGYMFSKPDSAAEMSALLKQYMTKKPAPRK